MIHHITDYIIQSFSGMSPEWATFWISMIPLTEIRASVPLALTVFDLPVWKVLPIAVIGNMVPAALILLFMKPVHDFVVAHPAFFGKTVTRVLEKAQHKFSGKYEAWGALALVLFVGIPLPGTGTWTGSLAAFVFGIPFKKAFPLIGAGAILSAVVLTLLTVGIGSVASMFS